MSKSSAIRYIWQVIDILLYIQKTYIKLPANASEWQSISGGFEDICGLPNCCFAIDGCLIEIERPFDFEGWYCRKAYPAINAQVVVDSETKIMSFDLRPGSSNDKSIYKYSSFGRTIASKLPYNYYGVGDAGYQLQNHLLTPYPITENMAADISHYNHLHSKTRISVERAFGMLKNRFRILKLPLNQKQIIKKGKTATSQMAKVIQSCMVLHNVLIELKDNDDTYISSNATESSDTEDDQNEDSVAIARRDAIKQYLYINRKYLKEIYD